MYSLKISEHLNNSKYGIKNEPTLQPLGYNFLPAAKGLTDDCKKKIQSQNMIFEKKTIKNFYRNNNDVNDV